MNLRGTSISCSQNARGYLLAIVASITYGLNPLFAMPLYGMGLDVLSVLFYRYIGAAAILALYMMVKGISFGFRPRLWGCLLLASLLFAVSSYTLFESYRFMDVGIASTILYVTPFFVAIIMSTVFHRHISLRGYLSILVAMIGIGLISIKYDSTIQNPVGIGFVLGSALVYSVYMVLLKESGLRDMHPVALTFYCVLVGAAMFALIAFAGDKITALPSTWQAYFNVGGLAFFPTIVSIVAMTVAIKLIGPIPTSILEALEPVTALVVGCAVFGEHLSPTNILGILIVLTSVSYFVINGKREHSV